MAALSLTYPTVFTVDASDIVIFGDASGVDYILECSMNVLRTIQYQDASAGSALFTTTDVSFGDKVLAALGVFTLIEKNASGTFVPASDFEACGENATPNTLGEMYIQYVASKLFGHPQAQAPIKNDAEIELKFKTEVIDEIDGSLNVTAELAENAILLSLFSQAVAQNPARFAEDDVATPQPLFQAGDMVDITLIVQGKKVTLNTEDTDLSTVWILRLQA